MGKTGSVKGMVIFFLNWVVRLYILSHISYLSEKLLWNIYNMNKVMNTTAVISVMPDYQTLEDTRKVFLRKCAVLVLEFDSSFRKIFNWVCALFPKLLNSHYIS